MGKSGKIVLKRKKKKIILFYFLFLFLSFFIYISSFFFEEVKNITPVNVVKEDNILYKKIKLKNTKKNKKIIKKICTEKKIVEYKNKKIYCETKQKAYLLKKIAKKEKDIYNKLFFYIKENIFFILIFSIIIFFIVYKLNEKDFFELIINEGYIINYDNLIKYLDALVKHIKQGETISNEEITKLEKLIILDFENLYKGKKIFDIKKRLYHIIEYLNENGRKNETKDFKILLNKIDGILYKKNKKWFDYIGNKFAYITSLYFTSLLQFFFFFIFKTFIDAILFKYIFYITSDGKFLKSNFWYFYETINIASNLGGNTEGTTFIQQLFLIYLILSGTILFGILIGIINDKVSIK